MPDETKPDFTAQMDQMGATLGSIAKAITQYRRELVEGGVHHETADKIAQDFAVKFHSSMFPPPPNPLAGFFGGGGQ